MQAKIRGQALVEFALMLPMLLVLVLATVDMARIYGTAILLQDAAKEAARVASTYSNTDAAVQAMAIAAASPLPIDATNITLCVNNSGCAPVTGGSMDARAASNSGQSVTVMIKVDVAFSTAFLTQFIGVSSMSVVGSSQMVII